MAKKIESNKAEKDVKSSKAAKEKKEPKRKPKYGMISCVGYIYRLLWQTERGQVFTGIFTVPITLILAALALYMPSAIVAVLESEDRFSGIALVILGLLLAKLLFDLVNNVIEAKSYDAEMYVLGQMLYMWTGKHRYRDWNHEFDPEVKKMDERVKTATESNHSAGVHFPLDFANMMASIFKFILFGSVISLLHPLIIVLLAMGSAINYIMKHWARTKAWDGRDKRNDLDKKIRYATFNLSRDFKYAKEIRLYSMKKPLHDHCKHLFAQRQREQEKLERRNIIVSVVSFAVVLIRDGAAYGFLIYKALHGEVDASSFVLYFSAITSMSDFMGGILDTFHRVSEGALQISDFREAMELEDKTNRGKGIPVPQRPFSIEFQNVSYKYPKGEKKVLENISFKIEAGEKIALVGLNGAGKTTLTMIMCGLILPDEGEVLLDGHSLSKYNRNELYSLFGFIPQDFHLLPVSIAKNIACVTADNEIDHNKLSKCIETAGLTEKIASLQYGADTPLNRELNENGVELSGGEVQKLLLARLLYKNPLCIILDEPTAALDPIAEDRMYRRYNEMAANATSVFISHRLASTKFCDRIFLLDGANFAEVGTHEKLMALGGKYKELFDVQSKYYREEVQEG